MGIWDWLGGLFETSPGTYYDVELVSSEFLESVDFEPAVTKDDFSHLLVVEFREPIREGNDIAYINLRSERGEIFNRFELPAGTRSYSFGVNPAAEDIDIVSVDMDGSAQFTDRISITEEVLE